MRTSILCILLVLSANVRAQTNKIATNSAVQSAQKIHDAQLKAVQAALPKYFNYEKDSVTDREDIFQSQYDSLNEDDNSETSVTIEFFIDPPARMPDKIGLHFTSHSSKWRFTEQHEFTIRYDDKRLVPLGTYYGNKVLDDATVTETIWPDFTLQQFHDIAFATNVNIKIGFKNYEIPAVARAKWKLLWKYFDLEKDEQTSELEKVIGEKP